LRDQDARRLPGACRWHQSVCRRASQRVPQQDRQCTHVRRCFEASRRGCGRGDALKAAEEGSQALDALSEARAKRLEALGASEGPPPERLPTVPARSAFAVSNADARKAEAEETLRLMRRKGTGELELEHAAAIRSAQRMAQQWLDAGLAERAYGELERVRLSRLPRASAPMHRTDDASPATPCADHDAQVVKFCSFKTDTGATFHLMLARIARECGRPGEARQLLQKVMEQAESSTFRWQAEQALNRGGAGGSVAPSASSEATQEMGKLFGKMPGSW
jgi:hypothetical protein